MSEPIRYTPEKRQELISRKQLAERFINFGWIPSSPEDLGEDFIVHIYFNGQATGVTFHVQEKSVTNLTERHRKEYLIYDFKVKDLKHWEGFNQPVVLVVWDIKLREGRWALLKNVIQQLDQKRPNWRNNKSKARIYIPGINTTDEKGLTQLRHSIGMEMYSLISKDKSLDMIMKFSSSETQQGEEVVKVLESLFNEGEKITLRHVAK